MPAPISYGPTRRSARCAPWATSRPASSSAHAPSIAARSDLSELRRAACRSFITIDGNQAPIARWGGQVATAIRPSERRAKEYGRDPRTCRFGPAYRFVFFPRRNPRQQARRQGGETAAADALEIGLAVVGEGHRDHRRQWRDPVVPLGIEPAARQCAGLRRRRRQGPATGKASQVATTNIPASPSSAGSHRAPAGGGQARGRRQLARPPGHGAGDRRQGAVKHAGSSSASGAMTPDYGCDEAQAERFQASAGPAPSAPAARRDDDDPGLRPRRTHGVTSASYGSAARRFAGRGRRAVTCPCGSRGECPSSGPRSTLRPSRAQARDRAI